MADNSKLEELLEQSIQAQNRTTHAVRALATYILIQIAWGIPGGILLALGSANANFTALLFGLFLLIVGFFHAFARATSELSKSEVARYGRSGVSNPGDSIADFSLTAGEKLEWERAGKPALQAWVDAGRPPFKEWLENGPF